MDRTEAVVFDETFVSYEAALSSAPYEVELEENGASMTIAPDIAFCERVTKGCTGYLTEERFVLTLDPFFTDHIAVYFCVGTEGAFTGGIDVTKYGACRDRPL